MEYVLDIQDPWIGERKRVVFEVKGVKYIECNMIYFIAADDKEAVEKRKIMAEKLGKQISDLKLQRLTEIE